VSSTSASLATQFSSTLAPDATSSKLFPHKSVQPRVHREEEGGKRDMYDPFQPTDGVMGEEGEKYDPFDPTGSPASDDDDDDDESGKVRGGKRKAERGGDDEKKEEEPPDSTDTLTYLPSPDLSTQLPLRRRVDCRSAKTREQRGADSDHSEIEEGEIVGAVDRDGGKKRPAAEILPMNSPSVSFFGSKPERILRVLDGDGFVSVRTESNWEEDGDPEDEPVVGVEDLRRKLVSRRKERYLSFPASSPLSPQPPPPSHPPVSTPSSPLAAPIEQVAKNRSKSSKSSKDSDRQKSKDRKAGEKEEKKKKSRKDKEGGQERSKEKERGHKTGKEVKARRSSRSSSRKRKKRQHSSPEASRSCNSSGRGAHTRQPFSSLPEERHREKERDKDRGRERDRDREREPNRTSSHRRDERDRESSPRKEETERKGRQHSSSRERGVSKRSKRSREKREGDGDRQRERERGRDGRPVVPPSIQDLNGSDLFAIKRTITVTTTTTTTTVPGSPRLAPASPCRPIQDSDKPHKRKKKRKWHSAGETDDRGSCHSQSQSISPPRYHGYDSDNDSDRLVIDVLSLDGEALDSDYPSLEDTPPAALCPDLPVPSPKTKTTPKTGKHHPKKKSHASKKIDQSSASSSKGKCLSSLTVTSGSAAALSGLPSTKRARKMGKDKVRDKGSRKDVGHSGKSKKESGGSRKGKLQSKVSVLVREGVSSTTGTSVGSGKMGMDLLGTGGTGVGAGGSLVGDSIAVVFCRDNESRSPFLKPCSEPLSLGNRGKDLAGMGKRSGHVAPPSSLSGPAGPRSKKAKPSSITSTSTSSSASSPSSSLASKRRRRLAKKTREKGGAVGPAAGDDGHKKAPCEGWGGASLDDQSATGDRGKSISPHVSQAGPAPCSSSSSSSSTSVLPPSSSPPHTPPPSTAPLRDTRESSPDSQTVDSSCKTPETSFLAEDCPTQTSPALPASSPPAPQGAGLGIALSTPAAKPPPPDDAPKSLASPPCSSSSAGCGFTSLSLPLSSSDPSSSSSVSSSSASKPPPPPPPAVPALPWGLPTGVDCTTGGVLACEYPPEMYSLSCYYATFTFLRGVHGTTRSGPKPGSRLSPFGGTTSLEDF